MRILLIESNEKYAARIKQKLQSFGHTVDIAFTFDGAQLMFETKPFDMVIVELETPEESIIDFLQYLRQTNRETPVYALTADYAFSNVFKDIRLDVIDVMNRPLNIAKVAMPHYNPVVAPKIIQPKTFHNFCLN